MGDQAEIDQGHYYEALGAGEIEQLPRSPLPTPPPGSQLKKLAQPFPAQYVEAAPQGKYGSYVAHHVINQRLLEIVGPFSFEVVELIRGFVPAVEHTDPKKAKPLILDAVVGVLGKLTVEIDGRTVSITEAGDCEQPQNWNNDGARAKDASSDCIKRCAMRLGLGLHLWAQDDYFLWRKLLEREQSETPTAEGA